MKRLSQAEAVRQLTGSQLKKQLYLSQLFILLIAFGISFWLFSSMRQWTEMITWNPRDILLYGLIPGLLIVLIDLLLMKWFPKKAFDDGGLNEKLFTNCSFKEVMGISLLVAFSEEALFRGVLQTELGYLTASAIFALVHVRYLTKPVLLLGVVMISFYLGWMYELTNNLLVTMTAHFVVDFILGVLIMRNGTKRGG
ncbi:CPBP family intramembrane glutamic endopeptidase [Virgibacillus senegalensis]|uniref:CPBP family intramembrane glutamic endopeptidase n=1 Tax=Virgibacillus senegalensis TaxID=1499679 RepID=UPI00069D0CD0|nr:type II CAAX endopeptidase family protein [Virgibacillus senegalensis]